MQKHHEFIKENNLSTSKTVSSDTPIQGYGLILYSPFIVSYVSAIHNKV